MSQNSSTFGTVGSERLISDETCSSDSSSKPRPPRFHERLFTLLSDPALQNIISWMPHGGSFIILRREEFQAFLCQEKGYPIYFPNKIKYESFKRAMSYWGFKMVLEGKSKGTYYNEFFQRDAPHLLDKMKYSKLKKIDSTMKKNTSAETTPTKMKDNTNLKLYDEADSSSRSGGSIYNKEKGLRSPVLLPMKRLQNENSSPNNHTFSTFEYNNNNGFIPEAVTSLPAAHIQNQSQQQYSVVGYQEEECEEKEIDTNHYNHDQLESNNNQSKDQAHELPYSSQTQSHVQPQPNEETHPSSESVTKKIVELMIIQKELNMQKLRRYEEQELFLLRQLEEVRKKKQTQEEEALNQINSLLEILKTQHETTCPQFRGPP